MKPLISDTTFSALLQAIRRLKAASEKSILGLWVLEVWLIFWSLLKIMVPVLILVRLVDLLGWITILGKIISPLMEFFGLPGEMGLVLVSSMMSNLYAGMAVFYQLGNVEQISIAQVSVLSGMMLLSHGLPIEAMVAKAAGVKLWFTLLLRIGGAGIFGLILHHSYAGLEVLQAPLSILWQPELTSSDWPSWLLLQAKTLLAALAIIIALTLVIHLLRYLGIEKVIHLALSPLLRLLGIGVRASNFVVVGLTLGLTFGGGILIREAQSGKVKAKDIFLTMALLGLCHSMIEDTILMMLLGADLSAILWGRLIFSIVVIALIARGISTSKKLQYTIFINSSVR